MDHTKVQGKLTQQELAARLGVSQMTVSRVLTGHGGVSKELKEKILKAIQEYDYIHDHIAAALRNSAAKVIGLVIPDVSNSFFPEITRSIEEKIQAEGYSILLSNTDESYEKECREINMLRGFRIKGLIIAPAGGQEDVRIYKRLQEVQLPFVFIDRFKEEINCSYVVTDLRKGTLLIGRYLLNKGYKKWGYLCGPEGISVCQDHREGLCESLREAGRNPEEIVSVESSFYEEGGYRAVKELFDRCKPDVVIAMTDVIAIGAYRFLREHDIKVPDDVGLVGFSDLKGTDLMAVPLTTVREPTEEIGKRAIGILMDQIDDPDCEIRQEKLEPKLIVRESA